MDIKTIVLAMWPYWLLGATTLFATAKSKYKDLIRVEKEGIKKFLRFLLMITVYRAFMFKLFPEVFSSGAKNISIIPWQMTLTVFWEDACHGLPLLLIREMIGTKKWTWPIHGLLTGTVMLAFGMGHVYQGLLPAIMLSMYIPYSISLGKKHGFGTVMICHTLYDLTTILSIKLLSGI